MESFLPSEENLLLELMARPDYQPLKQHELAHALHIKDAQRPAFRRVLYALERQGRVVCVRKNRWALPTATHQINGRLRLTNPNFGFVAPETPGQPNLYIPAAGLINAMDGDRVAVRVESAGRPDTEPERRGGRRPAATRAETARGPRGVIVRVLERAHARVVGLLRRLRGDHWYVIPDDPRLLHHHIPIRECAPEAGAPVEGHKVVVELDPWESPTQALSGRLVEQLGPADAPGVAMTGVLRTYNLSNEFPAAALQAANRQTPAPPASRTHRRDLRDWSIVTIDPADAKDFDDAVSLTRTPQGHWQLGVHIADVAYYVTPESPVDLEARRRGTSVYMVDRYIPMLPAHLTGEVCSLRPNSDRLAHTVLIDFSEDGERLRSETFRSVIRSSARLTYEQVQALTEDRPDSGVPEPMQPLVREIHHLATLLRRRRMAAGAIDLSLPEIHCELDAQGVPVAIHRRGADEAYQSVEECMLAANIAVAEVLARSQGPALYRIHEPPGEEQWAQMAKDLQALGVAEAPEHRRSLARVVRAAVGQPLAYSIHLAVLRNLKRAVYAEQVTEHFGLAAPCYTHFTSPIRRYPDLVVHRLLHAVETGTRPPYTPEDMPRLAHHCSWTEQNAAEAEQESVELKRLEFFAARLAAGETGPYPGLIVAVVTKGLIVELTDTLQRGLVPFSSLTDDAYVAHPERHQATGQRHRKTWRLGQDVTVRVTRVDQVRRRVDFALAATTAPCKSASAADRPVRYRGRRR